jgi:hypothetical protein
VVRHHPRPVYRVHIPNRTNELEEGTEDVPREGRRSYHK